MANASGGSIVWNLDVDSSKFTSGLAQAKGEAAAFGSSLKSNTINLKSNLEQLGSAFGGIADGLRKVVLVSAGLGVGAALIGKNFINLAGELQTTERQMGSLSGSMGEAKKVFGELYNFTLGKPIAFPDAAKAAQVLMGYGVATKDVVKDMKSLSAFAIVNGSDMGQLALAYGQVQAKGKLMGQEVLQLTNNFVPVSRVISKHFNVSIKEAQKLIEDGKVSAEDFRKAMANFIPEDELKKQSDTFKNRMISLQGTIRSLGLALLGVRVDEKLGLVIEPGGLFDRFSNLVSEIAIKLKELKPKLVEALGWLIENKEAVLGVLGGIVAGLITARGAQIAFNLAANANPYTLIATVIIGAIMLIAAAVTYLQTKFGTFNGVIAGVQKIVEGFWNAIQVIVTGDFKGGIFGLEEDSPVIGSLIEIHKALMSVKDMFKALFDFVATQAAPLIELIKNNKELREVLVAVGIAILAFLSAPAVAIGIVIAAITALIGAGLWLVNKTIEFVNWIKQTWENMVTNVKLVIQGLINFFNNLPFIIGFIIGSVIRWFLELPAKVGEVVNAVVNWFSQLPGRILGWLVSFYNTVRDWFNRAPGEAQKSGQNIVNGFLDWIKKLPGEIVNIFNNIVNTIAGFGGKLWSKANEIGKQFTKGLFAGLDKHSPSAAERAFMDIAKQSQMTVSQMNDDISKLNNMSMGVRSDLIVTPQDTRPVTVAVNMNNSGIVARSRSDWRDIMKDGIEAVNEELRAKGITELGGGAVVGGGSTL